MGIADSLGISRSALQAERLRMDVAANNIANMNSTRSTDGGPYRRQSVLLRAANGGTDFGTVLAGRSRASGGVQVAGLTSDTTAPRRVYEPSNPDAGPDGFVQYPNVDVTLELTDMISASRSYQANVTALNAIKTMAEHALEIGR
jgi:flagellar basal-body rod protein FlgC